MAIEKNPIGELPVNALEQTPEDAEFEVIMELPGEEAEPEFEEEETPPEYDHYENLAERLSETFLQEIGSDLVAEVEEDHRTGS